MNGEHEQCNDCGHVWEHEDDRCPSCGSQDTEEFNVKVKLKENWQQIEELEEMLQYVANEHLCSTKLLIRMKEYGIEYNKQNKH